MFKNNSYQKKIPKYVDVGINWRPGNISNKNIFILLEYDMISYDYKMIDKKAGIVWQHCMRKVTFVVIVFIDRGFTST